MSDRPIADHALLSDCRSAALVSTDGSIEWLCFPRFDGPAVFARLLDDDAGHWSIRPTREFDTSRRYVPGTMVLETTFRTPTGTVVLEDAMAIGDTDEPHRLAADAPGILVRRVTVTGGEVELAMEYAPRPEYGIVTPLLHVDEGFVHGRGGADVLMLSGTRTPEVDGSTARSRFLLRAGERRWFSLHRRSSWETAPTACTEDECEDWIEGTIHAWQRWSEAHTQYEGPWRDQVLQSGRVLQALTYVPTGAIVAAATTSLPETPGGDRNWDYRYAWVRDASFTLEALRVAACPDEAHHFFEWMAGATSARLHGGAELQIMFGVGGEHDLSERTLPHLRGWRGSAPVRVGNGAWDQRQLDVYGELLGAAEELAGEGGTIDPVTQHFLSDVAEAAASRWHDTDEGIWEVRGGRRDFVYSKLMCWAALDRAVRMADRLDAAHRVDEWSRIRDEIRAAILERGWSDTAKAFVQSFGSDELDASVLMMPIVGFLPADDPRMLATIDAIEERLTDDRGLVYRYRADDGLAGDEGTFLLCTFWLAQAQAMAGQIERAKATFERAIAPANDVGLLAEEVDPATGELLGNFPQAFSHIGLINAAAAIADAERQLA
jgi:alpha,alpha-trehalase